ncbi:MAG: hypothetical protein R3C99_10035 [Pirellulaceae bacterium]
MMDNHLHVLVRLDPGWRTAGRMRPCGGGGRGIRLWTLDEDDAAAVRLWVADQLERPELRRSVSAAVARFGVVRGIAERAAGPDGQQGG